MDAWPRGSSQGEHVSSGEGLHVHRPVPSRPARITAKPRRPHHALPRHHHCFSLLVWLVAILSIALICSGILAHTLCLFVLDGSLLLTSSSFRSYPIHQGIEDTYSLLVAIAIFCSDFQTRSTTYI